MEKPRSAASTESAASPRNAPIPTSAGFPNTGERKAAIGMYPPTTAPVARMTIGTVWTGGASCRWRSSCVSHSQPKAMKNSRNM